MSKVVCLSPHKKVGQCPSFFIFAQFFHFLSFKVAVVACYDCPFMNLVKYEKVEE